jgi:prepilin-type N-terminal cleavage/methylation domain-containing protein
MAPVVNPLDAGSEAGFTLLELLVALMVLVIGVTVAWAALMTTTTKTTARVQELSDLQTEVRGVVDRLAADLRQAQCDTTTTPATYAVTAATGTQITFFSPDRLTPYHLRQISYLLTNDSQYSGRYELRRQFANTTNTGGAPWTWGGTGAWAKQIGSVRNSTAFTYYDANGNTTTTASSVARVNVSLTVAPRAGLGGTQSPTGVTYQTNVDLRGASCS